MNLVTFDLRGPLAHFRRPDTMGTQATYPFITRTALRGLVASILGRESLPVEVQCGLRLLAPVRTVAQEMTMHGKSWVASGPASSFHRPTAIELVVKPHYRIYYSGPLSAELSQRLQRRQSHYHTYLGSAYCLTFPQWVGEYTESREVNVTGDEMLCCLSVVPSAAVRQLQPSTGDEYARVGGVLWEHIGERRFRGTVSLLYEVNGRPLHFRAKPADGKPTWRFVEAPGEGVVCLW